MKGIKGEVVALGDTLKNYVIGVGIKDNNFTSSLKNMGGKLSTFVGQMGLLLGAGSLGMAFKKFIDTGTDISNFSALTGIAEKDISALGGVLEKFGGNVDNAKSSLQSLQQGLSQAEWGQGNLLQTAALYGVELYNQDGSLKNAQQLLMGLADDFEHLTKAQQFKLGTELGLDESTILLLQQGKSNIKALLTEQEKMGVLNAKQAAEAKKFSLEWTKLKQSLASLGRGIATDIMPHILSLIKQLGKAIGFVRSLDTGTILLAGSFGVLGLAIKKFQSILILFSKSFWRANLPLIALITGLTLLFLIVEDIYSWSQGKKSIFGEILENDKIKKIISDIQNAFAWVKDLINNFSLDKLFDGLGNFAKGLKEAFSDNLAWVFDVISAIGTKLGAILFNPIIEGINGVLSKLPGKLGKLQIPKFEEKEINSLPSVNNLPVVNNTTNNAINNSNENNSNNSQTANNTQNNTVNIKIASSGNSLVDITNAAEKGINQANKLSPALLLNGAK